MGTHFKFNDTIKLPRERMPKALTVGGEFAFELDGARIFHLAPTRAYLVESVDGKWNHLGQVEVLRFTVDAETDKTTGVYRVKALHPPEIRSLLNKIDTPAGLGLPDESR